MKVLLVNGSSRENGCTNIALNEVARALNENGIETEKIFVGNKPISDCIACRKCRENGECIFHDEVNAFVEKAKNANGFVFGSPVYFATQAVGCCHLWTGRFIPAVLHLHLNRRRQYCLPDVREQRHRLMSSTSILPFALCLLFPQPTGIMSTAHSPNRLQRTKRDL